jgi:hypothetical protein
MEYYLVTKENEIVLFVEKWMELEIYHDRTGDQSTSWAWWHVPVTGRHRYKDHSLRSALCK